MNIYQAINNVMNEVGAIGKNRKNQQQGFMYRGIDEVMNALQPAFVKANIFVVPEVLEQTREERTTKSGGQLIYSVLRVKYTFYAADGTNVSATAIGEGMDSADKASNKAMSAAFKYACFQVFCIPTEEMVDSDAETPPPSERTGTTPQERRPATVTEKSVRVLQIEHLVNGTTYTLATANEYAKKKYGKSTIDDITESQYNDLYNALSQAIKNGGSNGK